MGEWIKTEYLIICCLQKTNVRFKHRYRLRVKRWKKISHANCNQKRAGGPIKTRDKTDFKTKMLTWKRWQEN